MIQLSDYFTYRRLLRYTFPSIIMLVFTSVYGVVDGFFVSNYVGKTPFAAVNFIMPFLLILGSAGFMLGTGGGALIAKTMGEGNSKKAQELFSFFVFISAVSGIVLAVLGLVFLRQVAGLLGAEGQMLRDSVRYGRIILLAVPFYILQYEFQCLFSVAEKPKLGLYVTVLSGVTNMVLDALFVAVFRWGLEGAAAATALSQMVGGIIPICYFLRPNSSLLRLVKFRFDGQALLKTCTNGSSELMSNISMSLMFVGYHAELLKITSKAFVIFSFSFLFSGIAIFGSSFFTALGDGLTSAMISFLRTLVFQCAAVILLPIWWGLNGIWFSIAVAEIMAVVVTTMFLAVKFPVLRFYQIKSVIRQRL